MVALESLSLGVPIVTTKTDGMMDLIKDSQNGFLYETDEQAVESILNLLNQEELLREMKEKCVQLSCEYNNIEKYKNEILKNYCD